MKIGCVRQCILLGVVSLAVPFGVNAAPKIVSVSGEFSHGATVTVVGEGFGTRGDFNNVNASWYGHRFMPFRVKDFDDQSLSSGGFNNPGSSWVLSRGGRTSLGHFATKYYNGQRLGALSALQRGTTGEWYLSYWFMMPAGTSSSKPFRIYGSGSAGNIYLASGGKLGFGIRGLSECSAPECSSATVWGSPNSFQAGKWHRVEILMSQAENGRITVLMDGKEQWSREQWLATSAGVYDGHTIDLGNMINAQEDGGSNSPENNSYNFDDAYFDFTQARVEISDHPTWSGSSVRELQVPVAWAGGMVSVAVNRGSFTEGASAYLYVIAADGSVNENGFPITFGGDAPSPPTAPRSVEIR